MGIFNNWTPIFNEDGRIDVGASFSLMAADSGIGFVVIRSSSESSGMSGGPGEKDGGDMSSGIGGGGISSIMGGGGMSGGSISIDGGNESGRGGENDFGTDCG